MYLIDGLVDLGHSLSRQENNISGNFTKAAEKSGERRCTKCYHDNQLVSSKIHLKKYIYKIIETV